MGSRTFRVLDVEYLLNLQLAGRLQLRPDFQRESIWPNAAKSYLIDTLLRDRPVPMLFLQHAASAQSGLSGYAVVDGQQHLRAIFEYIEGKYRLSGPDAGEHRGDRFDQLPEAERERIVSYGLPATELTDYSEDEIRDIFVRLNKYGVRLSPQELRHAQGDGPFKRLVEDLGQWPFWRSRNVVSAAGYRRMRADELGAELLILLLEGEAQDKKSAINDFYRLREIEIPGAAEAVDRLRNYLEWVDRALASGSRLVKATHLYGLVGALDEVTKQGETLGELDLAIGRERLHEFERLLREPDNSIPIARYAFAASRQTDNVGPRTTRIRVLTTVLAGTWP